MRTARMHGAKRWIASLVVAGLLVVCVPQPAGAAQRDAHVIGSLRLSPATLVTVAVAKAGLPMSGRVVFEPTTGRGIVVGVGTSGRFSVNLRPGTYRAFGGGRGWFPNCRFNAGKSFTVAAGHTVKVAVWCVAI